MNNGQRRLERGAASMTEIGMPAERLVQLNGESPFNPEKIMSELENPQRYRMVCRRGHEGLAWSKEKF